MHIAIDARMYGTAQRGIGRYLMKLIEGLEKISSLRDDSSLSDGQQHYTIFLRKKNFNEYQPRNSNFKKALWDAPWYGLKEQVTGYRLQVTGIDLVHFPHWNVPLLFRRPFVVTIHDLELFSSNRTRENSTRGRAMYWLKLQGFKIVFRHAVLAARAIIVPSHFVEEQLLDLYPQARKKVQVIYEAPTVSPSGHTRLDRGSTINPEVVDSRLRGNDSNRKYVLYVGAAYPHKNLPRLLEAWAIVHQELPDYQLVLVGREDWFWKRLKEEWTTTSNPSSIRRGNESISSSARNFPPLPEGRLGGVGAMGGSNSGVIFHGPATDAELSMLYKNAVLLVQPSLEEGFSLSPLEALAHGTPVAVSDIPVHREILQDAAFFFNPQSVPVMAQAILRALTDPGARSRIAASASAQVSRYSWHEHARKTRDLYSVIDLV